MTRKLSTIPNKFISLLQYLRGEMMRFKKKCTENPDVMDDWDRDDEGFEHLVQCNNEKKEVKRY